MLSWLSRRDALRKVASGKFLAKADKANEPWREVHHLGKVKIGLIPCPKNRQKFGANQSCYRGSVGRAMPW